MKNDDKRFTTKVLENLKSPYFYYQDAAAEEIISLLASRLQYACSVMTAGGNLFGDDSLIELAKELEEIK